MPRFKFTLSVSQGYDDNVFGASDNAPPSAPPAKKVKIDGNSNFWNKSNTGSTSESGTELPVTGEHLPGPTPTPKPGKPIFTQTGNAAPGPTPTGIIGSGVTRATVGMETQAANPRTAFTLNSSAGILYYWDRPGGSEDYNASLKALLFHRVTPRMNFSAQANGVYTAQPNFSMLNTPTTGNSGQYISGGGQLDVTYQWTARIMTDTSYNLNTTLYQDENSKVNDYYGNTLGSSIQYLLSPKTTLVAEGRVSDNLHPNSETQDTNSYFLLGGLDFTASPRLRGTTRAGAQLQTYASSGDSSLSPYLETSLLYLYGRGSQFNWTNRFGFEDSGSATTKKYSFRTGLGLNHAFTAKTSGLLGVNYIHSNTSELSGNSDSTIEQDVSLDAGIQFVVTRNFLLNLNCSMIQVFSTIPTSEYTRNQVFFGGTYSF